MKDYKLKQRNLRASHTLGWSWNWNTFRKIETRLISKLLLFCFFINGFPEPKDDTWEPLGHLSGSEHMIREFNDQWEKDYVRKTAETLEAQATRRKSAAEQNDQREDIDEAMGEGEGDERGRRGI